MYDNFTVGLSKYISLSTEQHVIKYTNIYNIYIILFLYFQWLKRLDKELEASVNSTNIIEVKGQKFVVLKTGEVYKDNGGFYVNKLVIKNVLGSDVGMYICLGANTMGYSFRSAFLTIVSGTV
jgi:hypothetical protein